MLLRAGCDKMRVDYVIYIVQKIGPVYSLLRDLIFKVEYTGNLCREGEGKNQPANTVSIQLTVSATSCERISFLPALKE